MILNYKDELEDQLENYFTLFSWSKYAATAQKKVKVFNMHIA